MLNKEERKEYNAKYYDKNKDKLKQKYCEKISCSCGSIVTRAAMAKHRQSSKHEKNLKNKAADLFILNKEILKLMKNKSN